MLHCFAVKHLFPPLLKAAHSSWFTVLHWFACDVILTTALILTESITSAVTFGQTLRSFWWVQSNEVTSTDSTFSQPDICTFFLFIVEKPEGDSATTVKIVSWAKKRPWMNIHIFIIFQHWYSESQICSYFLIHKIWLWVMVLN